MRMTMAMQVKEQSTLTSAILNPSLESLADPRVVHLVDRLCLLPQGGHCNLHHVPVALHLAPVNVALNDVRQQPLLRQLGSHVLGYHVSLSVSCIGLNRVLQRPLPRLNHIPILTKEIACRASVLSKNASMGNRHHQVAVAQSPADNTVVLHYVGEAILCKAHPQFLPPLR